MSWSLIFNCSPLAKPFSCLLFSTNSISNPAKLIVAGKYDEAKELLKNEVGNIFANVLEDAGVFKRNEKGQAGLEKFLSTVI